MEKKKHKLLIIDRKSKTVEYEMLIDEKQLSAIVVYVESEKEGNELDVPVLKSKEKKE